MDSAEGWARQQDCAAPGPRSNLLGTQAHKFCRANGYDYHKTQYAFRKFLR
jgi:hypothetical protein